jgi:hypothetical protein
MDGMQHAGDVGHRVLAEWIELQHRVALVPLPPEPPKSHPLLRQTAAVVTIVLMAAVFTVLIPWTPTH